MSSKLKVMLSRLRGFLESDAQAADFDEELEAHLEMAIEDKIRAGLSSEEARRQARVELGNLTVLRESGRELRGLPWIGTSMLDVKLGVRMLRKSWGLTIVAGLALTVVITLASVVFELVATLGSTELPFKEGERIVVLQSWDNTAGDGRGVSSGDFERWRHDLRSMEVVAAFRLVERNLQPTVAGNRPGDELQARAIPIAEVSASAFDVARVSPVLGRFLLEEDERDSAPPVMVIGEEVWESQFSRDADILGRQVKIDARIHTIVGVMPKGFGFPAFHRYWTPLKTTPESYAPDGGDEDLLVFGRLATDVSLWQAEGELRRLGRHSPVLESESETLELRVVPYVQGLIGEIPEWLVRIAALGFVLLLVPPCVNVAILVYARTVNRQGEFAARYVLGASRVRIVFQLFIEVLVLASIAGAVGLVIARFAVWTLVEDLKQSGDSIPFWLDFGLSGQTVLFVAGLAVMAALIAGAVPAVRATGRRVQVGLRSLGSYSQPHLGSAWTALVVIQVAVSFALLPLSVEMTWGTIRSGLLGPGFAADEYLMARLAADEQLVSPDFGRNSGFAERRAELGRRLTADPGIAAVTVLAAPPGEGSWMRIERADQARSSASGLEIGSGRLARVNRVDRHFFETFDLPILVGRPFQAADFEPAGRAVIVNQSFVDSVLSGSSPLGQRIRHHALAGDAPVVDPGKEPWFEIVGVTADLHQNADEQVVYHAAVPEESPAAVTLGLRIRADPVSVAGILRTTTWDLDPALRVTEIQRLDEIYRQKAVGNYLGASGVVAGIVSVLLLSAAGLFALMSFTVDRRRKEIGIRAALGASPSRLIGSVFARVFLQVGLGALAGVLVAWLVGSSISVGDLGGRSIPGVIPVATCVVVAVAALALVGPARRALRLDPIEELREG